MVKYNKTLYFQNIFNLFVTFCKSETCIVQKGDKSAMRRLDENALQTAYDAYADLLYRVALSHLRHREDALDAVQDVFVKLADSDKTFHDAEHERAWLIRVTVNRCHDLVRRRNLRVHTSIDEAVHIAAPEDPHRPFVLQAVDTLQESYKSVVVLHYLEGFSVEETARMLGLSVAAVKMRLSRARDMLKAELQ